MKAIKRWWNKAGYEGFTNGDCLLVFLFGVGMLMTVQSTRTRSHMIGLRCYQNGKIDVLDSGLNEVCGFDNWKDLKLKYPKVYGLYSFIDFDGKYVLILK
jgi:hypothetical protein